MVKRIVLIFSLFCFIYSSLMAQETATRAISLIPYPVSLTEGEGGFVFTDKTVVAFEDLEMEQIAEDFVALFSKPAGFTPKLKRKSKKGEVCIKKDDTLGEEAYMLEVKPNKIWIKAADVRGVFYALALHKEKR